MRKMMMAALAAAMLCGSAQALDFNFSVVGSSTYGTIYGLQDNAFSSPTSIFVTNGTISKTFLASSNYAGSFNVVNGTLIYNPGYLSYLNSGNNVSFSYYNAQNLINVNNMIIADNTLGAAGVIFSSAGSVPEPASWAMMVGGFGLIGVAMRCRKIAVRFA